MSDLVGVVENILGMPPRRPEPAPEPTDHAAEARNWIENAVNAQSSRAPKSEELAAAYAGIAQAHATLALVDELARIRFGRGLS